ncbi:MAG: TVP38/TMEM64 family protein [Tenericutes bacterium]|nr:TVP38/TMEM64 family protein [Mycoplasmatota bacterium]
MIELFYSTVDFIETSGYLGSLLACLLITVESIVPILPLILFVTINFLIYGKILGFILSWIFTVLGCCISFYIFKYGFGDKFDNLTANKEKINKYKKSFKNISFINLTILIAIPYTPAFIVNIAAGLTKMEFKKYFFALLIGKISLIYYMGYVGTSLIDSVHNPVILFKIAFLLLFTYIISTIINKVLKIK